MNAYPVQSIAHLTVMFASSTGAAADPTTVTLTVTQPDGAVQIHAADVVRDGVGAYHFDLAVTEAGEWRYRWQGAGALVAASPPMSLVGV